MLPSLPSCLFSLPTQVAAGETEIAGAGEEKESVDFESLFKMRVSLFLEGLYETNPTLATRIVLVPSLNDVFHDHVYPQVPSSPSLPPSILILFHAFTH
jgi:hypothetical protein